MDRPDPTDEGQFGERAVLMNSQGSGSKLPESDREDMEVFLEKMQQVLPALGVEVFVPTVSIQETEDKRELGRRESTNPCVSDGRPGTLGRPLQLFAT